MDSIKQTYDKATITKDLTERQQIIQFYKNTGYIDRDNAINKIKELRLTDVDVAAVTSAKLVTNSVPFECATNDGLIAELQMQVDILTAKVIVENSR